MVRQQQQEAQKQQRRNSLRSKAAHLVSDLTTVLLNPIADKPSSIPIPSPVSHEDEVEARNHHDSATGERSEDFVNGPDTSSFTAFLYSLLAPAESATGSNLEGLDNNPANNETTLDALMKGSSGKKSLLSMGKQPLGKAISHATRLGGFRSQNSGKGNSKVKPDDLKDSENGTPEGIPMQILNDPMPLDKFLEISEPSLLLSERTRRALYVALPSLVQGWGGEEVAVTLQYLEAWNISFNFIPKKCAVPRSQCAASYPSNLS